MRHARASLRTHPRIPAVTSACLAILAACGGSSTDADRVSTGTAAIAPSSGGDPAALDASTSERGTRAALPNLLPAINDSGFAVTYSLAGTIDRSGPFFQSLG